MDYKEISEDALKSAKILKDMSSRLEFYASCIADLLFRAKTAESDRDEARQDCAVAEQNHMIEVERRKAAEFRAKKAEMDRDKAMNEICCFCGYLNCHGEKCQWWRMKKEGIKHEEINQ